MISKNWLITAGFILPVVVYAAGGEESMNRPSAILPTLPSFSPDKTTDSFTLPIVPETPTPLFQSAESLFVQQITLQGNTVFSADELQFLIQPYQNRRVSIAELETLRQKITQHYVDAGYINSGADIPNDAYQNKLLKIVIIEGKLDEIRIRGQERLRESYIKNRLLPDIDAPFNLKALQENFQSLLADPLISRMNGRILPSKTDGGGILDVDVTRAKPYQLSLLGNNQRPPSIGAEAFGVNGLVRNLTGLGDSLDFTFFTSDGSKHYSGGATLPITDSGTQAFFRFDEGNSSVLEENVKKINIQSEVHSLEGGISQLLLNSMQHKLSIGASLAVRENKTHLLGKSFSFVQGESTGRNQATVVRTFQDYLWRSEKQAMALRSTISFGLNALDSTPANQQYPSSEFVAWLGQAQYAQQVFDDGSQIIFRGNTQLTDRPLLPLERISVGGMYTVRGYRENYLVRDEGYSLSAEFHYPLYGSANEPYRLTFVPFSDLGRAWNLNDSEPAGTLASVGAGLNMQVKSLSAELYYGYALYKKSNSQTGDLQDNGIHFQMRWDVF